MCQWRHPSHTANQCTTSRRRFLLLSCSGGRLLQFDSYRWLHPVNINLPFCCRYVDGGEIEAAFIRLLTTPEETFTPALQAVYDVICAEPIVARLRLKPTTPPVCVAATLLYVKIPASSLTLCSLSNSIGQLHSSSPCSVCITQRRSKTSLICCRAVPSLASSSPATECHPPLPPPRSVHQ